MTGKPPGIIVDHAHYGYGPSELEFVDDDIRAMFERKHYAVGQPTMIQILREVRAMRLAVEEALAS